MLFYDKIIRENSQNKLSRESKRKKRGVAIMAWNHPVPLELAQRVVEMIHEVTGSNVNFMGLGGEIIATKQPERLG